MNRGKFYVEECQLNRQKISVSETLKSPMSPQPKLEIRKPESSIATGSPTKYELFAVECDDF